MYFNKIEFSSILITLIVLTGCNNSKIIITSEFLTDNGSKEVKGFKVIQILPKDSLIPPNDYTESTKFRYASIADSTFKWNNKIFFNKVQKGFKWVPLPLNDKAWVPTYDKSNVDTIGKLENQSWYLFKGLSNFGYLYYAYIDREGIAKVYEINKSNY